MRPRAWTTLFVVLATTALAATLLAATSGYHADRGILIPGDGSWDYIVADTTSHRLFVTHGTRVQVVDAVTDSLVGEIPNTPGVHGVALAYDLGRGFTSNGRDSSVTVFDMKTLAVTGRVHVGARFPDAILYDQATGRVFTFNGGSANTTAIDARTLKVVGAIPLGGGPEAGVADGTGRIWVNNEDRAEVVQFDARKLKVLHHWSLAPGEAPSGLAFDLAHHRLFSGCDNKKLIVLDSETGRRVADLPIGEGVDGVAFDPAQQLVFSSNGDGTLTVIHEDDPDHYSVVENVPTQKSGRTLALDPRDGTVYIPAAELGPPPAPTPERPHPRPSIVPGSFRVVVVHR
jgi:DNA-binding beta-propeller fold protein YncE